MPPGRTGNRPYWRAGRSQVAKRKSSWDATSMLIRAGGRNRREASALVRRTHRMRHALPNGSRDRLFEIACRKVREGEGGAEQKRTFEILLQLVSAPQPSVA